MPEVGSRPYTANKKPWPNGRDIGESDGVSREMEERSRKGGAIGLSPQRPTARTVVHSPSETKRGVPVLQFVLIILAVTALAAVLRRPALSWPGPVFGSASAEMELGRLIVLDDFSDPQTALPVGGEQDIDQRYVGDHYRIQFTRQGVRVRVDLGQLNLIASRLETDLGMASQETYTRG